MILAVVEYLLIVKRKAVRLNLIVVDQMLCVLIGQIVHPSQLMGKGDVAKK
jgi:hypothetical protein